MKGDLITEKEFENIGFFKGMNRDILLEELKKTEYRILKFQKGEIVALRGDRIEGIYINISGKVVTEMPKDNGEAKKIEILESGTVLAGAFIFGSYNYFPVDIIAETDVRIFYLEKEGFLKLLLGNKNLLERFLDEVSEKAQFLSLALWKTVSNRKIDQKVAEYFLSHEDEGVVDLKLSIRELAEFFNVTRPSLSRVLKDMVDNEKISRMGKGKYRILDRDFLVALDK